jgi:hypothetical protein
MSKETEMKHEVLEMLKSFMLSEHGKKIKPKAVEVEVEVESKPKSKEGLEEVLEEASKEPVETDKDDKKRSMKEFFARK